MLEELYQNKQIILKKSQEFFSNSNSFIPKIGCELEFFLLEKNLSALENQDFLADLISELKLDLIKNYSLIYQVEKERGASQVEVKTMFTADLANLCQELESAKNFIKDFASKKNLIASFASQPFSDDCGSALQFSISMHDENGKNIFEDDKNLLKNSASKILAATNSMMILLAPKAEDYARFSFDLNRDLFKRGKFTAPVNLSFGADNRTCAIRIPALKKEDVSDFKYGRRIEYRTAAADADPSLIISAILLAISTQIKTEEVQFEQIFGNAFDEKYLLKNLCQNVKEAEKFFLHEENFIRKKFNEFLVIGN